MTLNETQKTVAYVGAAIVLSLIAWLLSPRAITPEEFIDQGEPFFPDFTDPNQATTLEVIDYDEETGAARPFEVTFKNGRWTIPSHHDYPADAEEQLAQTAAGVIDIKRDVFRTDNVAEHEAAGVIDPLDETSAAISGRGKRVTLKGQGGNVLADIIIGNEVLARPGYHFVRTPQSNRVYAARIDAEISTNFRDWIDRDLIQIDTSTIERIVIRDYSVNEQTLSVDQRDVVVLTNSDGGWTLDKKPTGYVLDSARFRDMLAALDTLSIVGVRPKPEGLSASLKEATGQGTITQQEQISLQDKGFYLAREGGLLANEGEIDVFSNTGVHYVLRFGEVLYGSGLEVSAGTSEGPEDEEDARENRYLFITAQFEPDLLGSAPPKPSNTDFQNKPDSLLTDADRENKRRLQQFENFLQRQVQAEELANRLNARFADWYYVIPNSTFKKIQLSRDQLTKPASS